ncbi:MAG: ABC transporter ATP-binding protein [Clostridiales Family XIII bacterium]|jgi:ABC-2 type transport system ATP-binding protein|nr:ABC transporter ATP-binding protein [Clostridiales Family XIII bacterium]
MTDFVNVENLTKKYGDLIAVDNLSFTVKEGEIFGFLGPNGAGKSTTLNVISTLIGYDSGNITVCGYDMAKDERKIKALIGLVPQDVAVYENMSAYENVAFFASLYGLSGTALKAAANEALEFVGLSEHRKLRTSKMSGGMKRRLNIACGIAHKPKLIVMDEPTVGVDAQSREHIMSSIRTLRSGGATIIYTSHYMPEVQEICDRIAIIDKGRLAAIGTKEELLEIITDVKTIYITCEFPPDQKESTELSVDRVLDDLKAVPDVRYVSFDPDESRFKIDVTLGSDAVTPLLRIFMDAGARIHEVQNEEPNLETTFLALTGRELR